MAGEQILVVEDNEKMRQIVVKQLESLGYHVVARASADAGLAVLAGSAPVDLLFTDIVMPGPMDGFQLARIAAASRPGVKILMTSGFSEARLVADDAITAELRVLSKPYRKQELARTSREILDAPPPSPIS